MDLKNKKKRIMELRVLTGLTTDQIIMVIRDRDYIFLKQLAEDAREKFLQARKRANFLGRAIANVSNKTDAFRKLAKLENKYRIKRKFFYKKIQNIEVEIMKRISNLIQDKEYNKEYIYIHHNEPLNK